MFRDLGQQPTVFTGIAAHVPFGASVAYRNQPVTGDGTLVSGSYFPTLGIRPALGRLLTQNDDQTAGNFVAVISFAYWRSRLGGDPNVLGKPLVVNGQSLTIVGVVDQGFEGTTRGMRPLVYVPISMQGALVPNAYSLEDRRDYWVYLFARLLPGVTLQQATAGLNGLYHSIINDVEAPLQKGMSDATLAHFRDKKIVLEPGRRGQSVMLQETKTPLLMLFGVTGIVLLIACANIANLLLARGAGRAMEMGVRLALGANRRRLVLQLLMESVLLAAIGGLASLLVASWTLSGIAALLPTRQLSLRRALRASGCPGGSAPRAPRPGAARAHAGAAQGGADPAPRSGGRGFGGRLHTGTDDPGNATAGAGKGALPRH
jgi:ABC-type antimicrobial peptide transport system permease subunit